MKFKLLSLIAILSMLQAFSQTTFESGYIILNNRNKTDCLIKNEDWLGSPKNFEYKFGENGDVKLGTIEDVKEFGSGQYFKYVRATLNVDQSPYAVGNLTAERNPIMKEETVFLKTLIEGKASLYFMQKESIDRYFYSLNGGPIEQLIFKRYMAKPTQMALNNRYKQQLATTFTCANVQEKDFENLEYKSKKLINLFQKYNTCENSEYVEFNKKEKGHWFNLSIRPGVTFSSLAIKYVEDEEVDFGNKTGFRVGLEMEFVLPFNNDKWALIIEPTYRSYEASKEFKYDEFTTFDLYTNVTATYTSIAFPIGVRHYFFLNNDSKIFINGAFVVDAIMDGKFESSNERSYNLELNSAIGTAFGLGFKFKNKYSVEAQFQPSKKLLDYNYIDSSFKSFSLIAGYNFL